MAEKRSGPSDESDERLGDGRESPLPVRDLIKIALESEAANRNFLEKAVADLPLDGGAGENRDAETRDQRLFDRLGASQFHDHAKQLLRLSALPGQQFPKRAQRSGSPLARY